jgi:hypothetical protein
VKKKLLKKKMASVIWNESKRGGVRDKPTYFRGMWAPTLNRPTPVSFVPRAPAPKPKKKNPPPPIERDTDKLKSEPPKDIEVWITVYDRYKEYRGAIAHDGTCLNAANEVLGYIDFDQLEAGSTESEFLGVVKEYTSRDKFIAEDDLEQQLGIIDRGLATIKDPQDNTIVEFDNTGEIKGNKGDFLGEFRGGFTYHDMPAISLWLLILDPGMIAPDDDFAEQQSSTSSSSSSNASK